MSELRRMVTASLTPEAQARMDSAGQNFRNDQAFEASISGNLSRGWTSAGLSERANQLLWDASTAYKAGDLQTAGALEAEGRKIAELASVWSPEVKNWSDVHDLSSGAKWAAGALGNIRSSIMPAIGGLLGAAGGGLLTRSAQGARWGAGLGAGLMGYDQMTNETAGQAMLDPQIRANKTIDDIRGTSRVSGAIQAPLEALVPATMGTALLGLAKGAGKQAIKTAVAKEVGREAAGEFGTEFAQDLVGQGAINTLKDRPTTELDYRQALDSAMAGAVAGGGMGLVGGAGQAAHLAAGNATDTAVDVAKDPSKLVDAGAAGFGAVIGKGVGWFEGKMNGMNVDPDERALMSGHREVEKNMSGEEFLATRRAAGDAVAGRVLAEPNKYGKEEVEAAQAYMAGGENRNVFRYREARLKFKGAKQAEQDAADEIDELNGGKVRASKMRARTVDDFGNQVTRDNLGDQVIDDQGNVAKDATYPEGFGGTAPYTDAQGNTYPGTETGPARRFDFSDPAVPRAGFRKGERQNPLEAFPAHEYGGEVERRVNDPHLMPERNNLAERRRIAGEQARTADPSAGSFDERDVLARQRLNEEGRAAKEKVKSDWESTRSILADIWRKQGVDEGILHETRGIDNDSNRQFAITMMDWVKRGFKTQDGETVVPERMISNHGVENATHLVKKASDLLVRQGVLTPEDAKARLDEMLPQIKEVGRKWKADEEAVFSSLTPTAEAKINESFDGMDESEIARERQALVREIREIGRKGNITKAQEATLDQLFGPKKNELLDHFYVEKESTPVDGEAELDSLTGAVDQGNEDDNEDTWNEKVDRSDLGFGEHEIKTSESKVKYRPLSKAVEYFDMHDEEHRSKFDQMTKEQREKLGHETASIKKVGMVDREIEKERETLQANEEVRAKDLRMALKAALMNTNEKTRERELDKLAKKHGVVVDESLSPEKQIKQRNAELKRLSTTKEISELTPDQENAVRERVVAKHGVVITKPAPLREGATAFEVNEHKAKMRQYEADLRNAVKRLNSRFKTMRVSSETNSDMEVNLTAEQVERLNNRSMKLDSPKATYRNGTLIFQKEDGTTLATTANQIYRAMSRIKDGSNESTNETQSSVEHRLSAISAGIASIMTTHGYGKMGIIKRTGAAPTWLTNEQPDVKKRREKIEEQKNGKAARHAGGMPSWFEASNLPKDFNIGNGLTIEDANAARGEREVMAIIGMAQDLLEYLENRPDIADSVAKKVHEARIELFVNQNPEPVKEAHEALIVRGKDTIGDLGRGGMSIDSREAINDAFKRMNIPAQTQGQFRTMPLHGSPASKAFLLSKIMAKLTAKERATVKAFWGDRENNKLAHDITVIARKYLNRVREIMAEPEDTRIVPSERKPGRNEEEGSFREDHIDTLGKSSKGVHHDERGFLKSDNTAMVAGHMAGSEGTVIKEDNRNLPKPHEEKVEVAASIKMPKVIDLLRRGIPTTMSSLRWMMDNEDMRNVNATIRYLDELSEATPSEALTVDPTLKTEANAERLVARAKEALRRARAIVDQGGVSDAMGSSSNGSLRTVGEGDAKSVRADANGAVDKEQARGSQGDRAVAGEVRRDEGVAGRATPGDARAGLKKWLMAARTAPIEKVKAQISKMTRTQMDALSEALSDYDFLNEIDYDIDGKGAARLVDIEDLIYDNYPSEGTKASSAKASNKTLAMDSAEVKAAKDHILKTVGPKIGLTFVKAFQDGRSGEHRLGLQDQENLIRLALNGDVVGTAYHESIHEFFDILSRKGATSIRDTLERAGKNKRLLREVSRLLDGSPEAQAQLKDPQEAVAYIYQFWKLGKLNLGNETQTLFEKVSAWLRNLLGMISEEMKADMDLAQAEKILKAFDDGWVGSDKTRDFIIAKLNAETEQHNEMVKGMGQGYAKMMRTIGHVVMPVEQVIEATGNKRMIGVLRKFHQKTGDQMGEGPGYFEAVSTKRNQYLNKLENVLHKADPKDVELAREHLSKGTEPTDPVVKSIFLAVREVLDDIYQYARESQVARWDEKTHEWVVLPKRKNYFPQVWSVETIVANMEEFKQLLLEHHQDELAAIAGEAEQQGATPEMVADNIIQRVINSHGQVETSETESNLGISPMAAAVNKRALDWLNKDAFDKFKEKDLVSIMTSYVDGMVKRAEYTKRFGWGGAMLKEEVDMAFAEELGGEKLVKAAEDLHFKRVGDYLQARQKDPNTKLTEPDRRESIQMAFAAMHAKKGKEFIDNSVRDAVGRLEKANKAVMALEGTLGRDIHDNIRTLNSWMMTYQNFRLLSTTLFASFADTVGIMINGGEIKDAWEGFVRGIREVKLRWGDDKSQDIDALRAEAWGVADAGSFMDSIGQTYGSLYMNGAARRMSDKLFKYNGMEAWNRAMRIQAAKVAERVIMKMKTEGVDKHDKAAVARFEDLFGKQFKPEDIKLDANGQLDQKDVKNVAAVNRWVNGAILRPNAAQRPHWASDPHYSMLWHMKQFTYTFQNVILEKVITQAKLGNYRPAMVMMAGYTPVIIAADAVKEMLIPGDEPPWMKAGLSGLLQHGVDKAGLLGIGQLGYDAFAKDYGASLTGPAISQLIHIPMDDPAQTALGALPFGNLARRLAQ